jgi:hypothetical protein
MHAGRRLEGKADNKRKFNDAQYWDDLEEETHNTKKAVMAAVHNRVVRSGSESEAESEGENDGTSSSDQDNSAKDSSLSDSDNVTKKKISGKEVSKDKDETDTTANTDVQKIQNMDGTKIKANVFAHWDETDESD